MSSPASEHADGSQAELSSAQRQTGTEADAATEEGNAQLPVDGDCLTREEGGMFYHPSVLNDPDCVHSDGVQVDSVLSEVITAAINEHEEQSVVALGSSTAGAVEAQQQAECEEPSPVIDRAAQSGHEGTAAADAESPDDHEGVEGRDPNSDALLDEYERCRLEQELLQAHEAALRAQERAASLESRLTGLWVTRPSSAYSRP